MPSIMTIIGNRPQFIKMAPVSRALKEAGVREMVVHSGQHHDVKLNGIFFEELGLPTPDIQLATEGSTHGAMTGDLLTKLEQVFLQHKPRAVLLYGDTNTTLAAALAAAKLHIRIAHVEAGPRFYDMTMPEEVNRVMVDHVSELLFCPDAASVANLAREGITRGVYQTGDVMLDAFRLFRDASASRATVMQDPRLQPGQFVLATLHRPSNVDSRENLEKTLRLLEAVNQTVLFPAHLRTLARLKEYGLMDAFTRLPNLVLAEPLGYLDVVAALTHCSAVLTDSGGLQKEAYYAGKRSVVCLDETPWPDLKASGWQKIVGTMPKLEPLAVAALLSDMPTPASAPDFYGTGHAAQTMVAAMQEHGFFG